MRPHGLTEQDFHRDAYECRREAEMLPPMPRPAALLPTYTGYVGQGYSTATPHPDPSQGLHELSATLADQARRESMTDHCLEAKGYRRATAADREKIAEHQARAEGIRYTGRPGLRVEPRDGSLVVVNLAPGGPADRAGLLIGDRLVKVGGISVGSDISPDELTGMLGGTPGSKVMVTVARGAEEKDVVLVREVLPQW
jgi:C-terminal processing protease CtpA/Prc